MESSKPSDGPPSKTAEGDDDAFRCDVCGGPAYEMRCEIICRRCGYTRDCSDP